MYIWRYPVEDVDGTVQNSRRLLEARIKPVTNKRNRSASFANVRQLMHRCWESHVADDSRSLIWTTEGDVRVRRSTPAPNGGYDSTASSGQLAARWSTATGVLISASSIRRRLLHCGSRAIVPLYRILFTPNHRWLRQQWAHEHRPWPDDCHQAVFLDTSRFNLWSLDCPGKRWSLNLSRAEPSSRWCGVVVWRGVACSGVVHVTSPWFKIMWSIDKSPRVAEQCDVTIQSINQPNP
ncbi:transposable element Tcb2 transposase [Trichonephila clavipes]|nr:transposable element Tcb2 transposase [Trichonephila clavipes]